LKKPFKRIRMPLDSLQRTMPCFTATVPVCFSPNKANKLEACYSNLGKYDECIQDCTEALKINPSYMKALNRRAAAYEKSGENYKALVDYTAMCIMEEFKVETTIQATDRMLKQVALSQVEGIMDEKKAQRELPSAVFITAYLDSFRTGYTTDNLVESTAGDATLKTAIDELNAKDFTASMKHTQEALVAGISPENESVARNLLGTYKFLIGDVEAAVDELNKSLQLDPDNVNSMIKLAGCFMEKGEVDATLDQFDRYVPIQLG